MNLADHWRITHADKKDGQVERVKVLVTPNMAPRRAAILTPGEVVFFLDRGMRLYTQALGSKVRAEVRTHTAITT